MPIFPGFVGPSNVLDSVDSDVQRTVNLFLERNDIGTGKSPWRLRGRPGLETLMTLTVGGPVIGLAYITRLNKIFAVCEDSNAANPTKLYEITLAGGETDRGNLHTASGGFEPASISYNFNGSGQIELLIVLSSPNKALLFNTSTNVLTDITATVTGNPDWGEVSDSYFIIHSAGSNFYLSALNDGLTWNALDVGGADRRGDLVRMIVVHNRELWLFGDETIEIWFNSGNADFPFEPIQGAMIQWGISYPNSALSMGGSIMWVGRSDRGHNVVYRADGYNPVRVSTHAVEQSIHDLFALSADVFPRAWSYEFKGNVFYVLTFPDNGLTWVYNLTSGLWHEETYLNGSTEEAHRAQCHCFKGVVGQVTTGILGEHLVGDRANGKIYRMRDTYYDDAGDPIDHIRTAPHLHSENKTHFYPRLELDVETGSEPATTLNGAIDDSVTSMTVVSTSGFPAAPSTVLIDSEYITYTGLTATTITGMTRGAHGTTAASHADAAAVTGVSEYNLEISDDGGHTFKSALTAVAGAQADYDARLAWRRLGSARDKVFRVSSKAPIRHSWNGAYLDVELGDH